MKIVGHVYTSVCRCLRSRIEQRNIYDPRGPRTLPTSSSINESEADPNNKCFDVQHRSERFPRPALRYMCYEVEQEVPRCCTQDFRGIKHSFIGSHEIRRLDKCLLSSTRHATVEGCFPFAHNQIFPVLSVQSFGKKLRPGMAGRGGSVLALRSSPWNSSCSHAIILPCNCSTI